MRLKSIASRMFFFIVPAIVVTVLLFVLYGYYISSESINESINEKMAESLRVADLKIQLELQKNAAVAEGFAIYAKTMELELFDHEKHKERLALGIFSNKNTFGGGVWYDPYQFDPDLYYFGPYLYADRNGNAVYVPDYGNHVDYFNEDWYIRGQNSGNDIVWSDAYLDPVSGATMITSTKPMYAENGRFIGVCTSDMTLADIREIAANVNVGRTGTAFILGANGEYISFFEERSVGQHMQNDDDTSLARLGQELMRGDSNVATLTRDGQNYRVYYTTMENVSWKLGILIKESEISSSTLTMFLGTVTIPLIGLAVIILAVYLVTRYLLKIVGKVNRFAELAASGNLNERIEVNETDEFGRMEHNLNIMIAKMATMNQHQAEVLKMAENANRAKSDFLSRMSHEIRTPMNAIIGMSQIAKTDPGPERTKDCIVKIENASRHLLSIINDILDMSKIEANKMELVREEFSPEQALMNIYNMIQVKSEEKKQRLTLEIAEDVPKYIIGDELRFSQILTNLISNAVKFTPVEGEISVTVCETGGEEPRSRIEIRVKDNGIGLSEEQRARLFHSFEQGDGSVSRKYGGTGLGLAISKHLAEMMEGDIQVESEAGKGSCFIFFFNATRSTGNTVKPATGEVENVTSLRLLAVDDSEEALEYFRHVLNSFGMECETASDGAKALRAVEQSIQQERPYDIIFMDYMMPELNGIEAAQKIREISGESTAIIMISIYDWKDIEISARAAGIQRHITKPVSPSCLFNSINETASSAIKKLYAHASPQIGAFDNCTILLAEDIDINREIIAAFLEKTSATLEYAENGRVAVEKFRENPEKYDLILMDIQMPEMDGYEATRRIRAMDFRRAKTIPIVAMTANAFSEDVRRCLDAGMNDHMSKPVDPDLMLLKLNDYLFMKDFLDQSID